MALIHFRKNYMGILGESRLSAKWLFIIAISLIVNGCQQSISSKSEHKQTLTQPLGGVYYLIRHSEKDRTNPDNKDPELTTAGLSRARIWQQYFDSIPLSGIYSTGYKRTLQTIIPTAASKSLDPIIYLPHDLVNDDFLTRSNSGRWLIVGHSNTIPELTNALMNIDSLKDIPDSLNSRLYRVDYRSHPTKLSILHID